MAEFKMDIPQDLSKMLGNLENAQIGKKALARAETIVVDAMKSDLSRHHRAKSDKTYGQMVESIKATGIKANRYGEYDFVRPTGKDSKGVRNMEKLAYLEYGTVRQVGIPVVRETRDRVKEKVVACVEEALKEEMGLKDGGT